MGEDETKKPVTVPLNKEQKETVSDDLEKRGANFFTWEQLQELINQFGPNAKLSDVQKALKEQNKPNKKQ